MKTSRLLGVFEIVMRIEQDNFIWAMLTEYLTFEILNLYQNFNFYFTIKRCEIWAMIIFAAPSWL